MKKIFGLLLVFITACSQNNDKTTSTDSPTKNDTSFEIDISKLSSQNLDINEPSGQTLSLLNFGSISSGELVKILILKNTSSSLVHVPLSIEDSSQGFKVKLNRCPSSLPAGGQCSVSLSFSARGKNDGTFATSLSIPDHPENLALNIQAQVTGNPSPDQNLSADLEMVLSSGFYSPGAIAGSVISRTLKVINHGPGYVPDVQLSIPPDYVVRIDHCGALKSGQSCYVILAFKDSRRSVVQQSSMSSVTISSSSNNVIGEYPLILATGLLDIPANEIIMRANYSSTSQVKPNIRFVMGNEELNFNINSGLTQFNHTYSTTNTYYLSYSLNTSNNVDYLVTMRVDGVISSQFIPNQTHLFEYEITCINNTVASVDGQTCIPSGRIAPSNLAFDLNQCNSKFGLIGDISFQCFPTNGDSQTSPPNIMGSWNLGIYNIPDPENTYAIVSNDGSGCSNNSAGTNTGNGGRQKVSSLSSNSYNFTIDPVDLSLVGTRGPVSLVLYSSQTDGQSMDQVLQCQEIGTFHYETTIINTVFYQLNTSRQGVPGWCAYCILPDESGVYRASLNATMFPNNSYTSSNPDYVGHFNYFTRHSISVGGFLNSDVINNPDVMGGSSVTLDAPLSYSPGPIIENLSIGNSVTVTFNTLFSSQRSFTENIGENVLLLSAPKIISVRTNDPFLNNYDQIIDYDDSLEFESYNLGVVDETVLRRIGDNLEVSISCNRSGNRTENLGNNPSILCSTIRQYSLPSGNYNLVFKSAGFAEVISLDVLINP